MCITCPDITQCKPLIQPNGHSPSQLASIVVELQSTGISCGTQCIGTAQGVHRLTEVSPKTTCLPGYTSPISIIVELQSLNISSGTWCVCAGQGAHAQRKAYQRTTCLNSPNINSGWITEQWNFHVEPSQTTTHTHKQMETDTLPLPQIRWHRQIVNCNSNG